MNGETSEVSFDKRKQREVREWSKERGERRERIEREEIAKKNKCKSLQLTDGKKFAYFQILWIYIVNPTWWI